MCQRTVCRGCGKPTYVGCGNHVEQVLGDVPLEKRCSCEPVRGSLLKRLGAFFGAR